MIKFNQELHIYQSETAKIVSFIMSLLLLYLYKRVAMCSLIYLKGHLSNQMFYRCQAGRQIFQGIEHLPGLVYNNLFQLFQTVFILTDIQGWCILPLNHRLSPTQGAQSGG